MSDAARARLSSPLVGDVASHPGIVRPTNQDAFLQRPEIGLWAVADGMGGLAAGEKASRAVVDGLARIASDGATRGLVAAVETCLTRVNDDLRWEAQMGPAGTMMGSTVVVLLIDGGRFTCLWAGDSRLYRLRDGTLDRLTTDHTPMQEMIDAGLADAESACGRLLEHVVSRAVGTEAHFALDCTSGQIEPDDTFLLCTDGLTKSIDEAAIGWVLGSGTGGGRAQRLIDAAMAAGGSDNTTAIVVHKRVAEDMPAPQPVVPASAKRPGARWRIALGLGLGAAAMLWLASNAEPLRGALAALSAVFERH